ncbi:MAG: hypothetical protein ABWK00_05865 [Desulfurococcaceae archaeon]
MRKAHLTAVLALLVASLASAAPLTVNIQLTTPFTKYYVYTASGLLAQGNIVSNKFSFDYNSAQSYLVKAVGNGTVLVFTVPSGLTATTFNVTTVATIKFNITFLGKWPLAPKAVQAQVAPQGAPCNATVTTSDLVDVVPPATVKLQEEVFFPSLFGYRLSTIYINGAIGTNPFNVTNYVTYTVKAEYEPVGIAAIDPIIVAVAVGAVVILAVALSAKRGAAAAATLEAYSSPYLE